MKKIIFLSILLLVLGSCSTDKTTTDNKISSIKNECNNSFKVGNIKKTDLNLKGVVINDGIKTVSSPMPGIISNINCNSGDKVTKGTLIATIKPDFNNPNTVNLSIQKNSLVNQKVNLESIRASTVLSFDNQISDLKQQISIVEKNIGLTKKSSSLSKKDLGKQITSLEDALVSLKSNLELTKKAKADALEKVDISRTSLFTSMKSLSSDNLLKIDEIFGITEENKSLNDAYENYISAKNISLYTLVKSEFYRLNDLSKNIDSLSDNEISNFLGDLITLDETARNAIKNSVANVYFPQTQMDSLYTMYLTYGNNLADIKNGWDSLANSKSSIETSYDTQISSLQSQIDTNTTSLENLKTNKLDSVDVGLDLQLANLDSQLKTLNSSLTNLVSTKKTQVLGLDNQILQVKQSIDSLNTNLVNRNVYAGVDGTVNLKMTSVGNNVGINSPICQILPNINSTRVKIYSPISLEIGDKFEFNFSDNTYIIEIENELQTKDPITQNYIYESNYLDALNFKGGEIFTLKYSSENIGENDDNFVGSGSINNIVPVSYIINKINGNFINAKTMSGVVFKEVQLGDINGNSIEIVNGLEGVSEICK